MGREYKKPKWLEEYDRMIEAQTENEELRKENEKLRKENEDLKKKLVTA